MECVREGISAVSLQIYLPCVFPAYKWTASGSDILQMSPVRLSWDDLFCLQKDFRGTTFSVCRNLPFYTPLQLHEHNSGHVEGLVWSSFSGR